MDVSKLSKNIEKSCDGMGSKILKGISLEEVDPSFLDPREGDLDEHVAMQASAMAYYGVLYKQAQRDHEDLKRSYERWRNKKFLEIASLNAKKAPIKEIDAEIDSRYSDDVTQWESRITEMKQKLDDVEVYYDAWKQKSYMLRIYASMNTDEIMAKPHIDSLDESKKAMRGKMGR